MPNIKIDYFVTIDETLADPFNKLETNSSRCCCIRCVINVDVMGRSISPNFSECNISNVCCICAINSSSIGFSFGKAKCKS